MTEGTEGSEPAEHSDDPIIRWEPPEPDPDDALAAPVPAFVPGQRPAARPEAETDDIEEPGPNISWEKQPIVEAPPPAPKGQWWPGWLADPRGRHEFRYWNGSSWTDHVADSGLAGLDPL
ncbi:MAG: DUF2510 domain-containing protein [Acidimicrobiales bacterium]